MSDLLAQLAESLGLDSNQKAQPGQAKKSTTAAAAVAQTQADSNAQDSAAAAVPTTAANVAPAQAATTAAAAAGGGGGATTAAAQAAANTQPATAAAAAQPDSDQPGSCVNPNIGWTYNSANANPCQMFQMLQRICDSGARVQALSTDYVRPNTNLCNCNVISYNLASACWTCQNTNDIRTVSTTYNSYVSGCANELEPVYPASNDIAQQVFALSLPYWVYDYPPDPNSHWAQAQISAAGTNILPSPSATNSPATVAMNQAPQVTSASAADSQRRPVPLTIQINSEMTTTFITTAKNGVATSVVTVAGKAGSSIPANTSVAALQAASSPGATNPNKGVVVSTRSVVPVGTGSVTESEHSGRKSNIGPIVGGVIGGLIAFVGLFFLFVCVQRRRRRKALNRQFDFMTPISPDRKSYSDDMFMNVEPITMTLAPPLEADNQSAPSERRPFSWSTLNTTAPDRSRLSRASTPTMPRTLSPAGALLQVPPPMPNPPARALSPRMSIFTFRSASEAESNPAIQESDVGRAPSTLIRHHNNTVVETLDEPLISLSPQRSVPPTYQPEWLRTSVINGTAAARAAL